MLNSAIDWFSAISHSGGGDIRKWWLFVECDEELLTERDSSSTCLQICFQTQQVNTSNVFSQYDARFSKNLAHMVNLKHYLALQTALRKAVLLRTCVTCVQFKHIFFILLEMHRSPHSSSGIRNALLPYLYTECLGFLKYLASPRTFTQHDYALVAGIHLA